MDTEKLLHISVGLAFGILAFSVTYSLIGILVQPEQVKLFIRNLLEGGE